MARKASTTATTPAVKGVSLVKETPKAKRQATAQEVRDWGKRRGFDVSETGPLSGELVSKFNEKHTAVEYTKGTSQPARVVKVAGTVKARNGRVVTVETTMPKVRKWATAAGFQVGTRGRIPADVLAAYADRETVNA